MSKMLGRIVAVSMGIETTYGGGTPDPLLASANLLFRNGNVLAPDRALIDLAELRDSFTKSGDVPGRGLWKLNPGYVIMGHGGAASLATFRLSPILKAMGFTESAPGTGSLRYVPRTTETPNQSAVINVEMASQGANAIRAQLKGGYGTYTMAAQAGGAVTLDTEFQALYAAPTNPAKTSPTLPSNTAEPFRNVGLVVTPEDSAGADTYTTPLSTLKFKSFNLVGGVDIQEDTDANQSDALAGLVITDRNPTLTCVYGLDDAQYDDFLLHHANGIKHKVNFVHGSGVGKRMRLTAYGQITGVDLQDDVGIRTVQVSYNLRRQVSEGELQLDFD